MSYSVFIAPAAKRAITKLPKTIRTRIDHAIVTLADNPRPRGCVKLAGTSNGWRIRIADWRVLYTIEDDKLIVLVVEVGHRRDIYRGI